MDEDDFTALWFEGEIHATQITQRFCDSVVTFARCVEHEEATAAGAEQLATDGAGLAASGIPVVDGFGADGAGEAAFEFPVFVNDLAKSIHVVLLQLGFELAREFDHAPQRSLFGFLRRDDFLLRFEEG